MFGGQLYHDVTSHRNVGLDEGCNCFFLAAKCTIDGGLVVYFVDSV